MTDLRHPVGANQKSRIRWNPVTTSEPSTWIMLKMGRPSVTMISLIPARLLHLWVLDTWFNNIDRELHGNTLLEVARGQFDLIAADQSDCFCGAKIADDYPYIDLVARKIRGWIAAKHLPYQVGDLQPTTDECWRHLQRVLTQTVRLSEPLPIACDDPSSELKALFSQVVHLAPSDESLRIDGLVTRSLGKKLSLKFHRGAVDGFGGKPVSVMRLFRGVRADVVLEGINLAGREADKDADAIVGKLWRARSADGTYANGRRLIAVVGYTTSGGDLNGNSALVTWIASKGDAKTFSLDNEQQELRHAAETAVQEAGPAGLFPVSD